MITNMKKNLKAGFKSAKENTHLYFAEIGYIQKLIQALLNFEVVEKEYF